MDIKDVENLANLARLDLADEEKATLLKDLDDVLDYVKVIEDLKIEDSVKEYDIYNVWREDLPSQIDKKEERDLIVDQFPDSQDGFLKVKKIL
jgi:aspartyl-tRNA(Asn)/glutamyl-tRNA(Gln) amidotransferase subunit C